jgi:hypothetical protein
MELSNKMIYILLTSTFFSFSVFSSVLTQYGDTNIFKKTENSNSAVVLSCNEFPKEIIEETSSPQESKDNCWWLDSGAIFRGDINSGSTNIGELPLNSYWRKVYFVTNPVDTDNGLHPQNIFRFINQEKWKNNIQSLSFKITKYHLSQSPNRNVSNGVLLMSHYQDGNNLYYAGLRVDGTAVIKKKINGVYITLGSKKYDTQSYDPQLNPIILPMNRWISEKFITQTTDDDSVRLKLFADLTGNGNWELLLDVKDTIASSGAPPIREEGNVGIRSDFMDVEFNNYKVEKL